MNLIRKIPKAEKPKKKRREQRFRSDRHKAHVRQHACVKCGSEQYIQAAHVRLGTDGGMGLKPSDYFTVSLCHTCHHDDQHRLGEGSFWKGFNVEAIIEAFQRTSPVWREIQQHKREQR